MEFIIYLITFLLFLAGLYFTMNLNMDDIAQDMDNIINKQASISKRAEKQQKKKKDSFILRFINDFKLVLASFGQSNKFIILCVLSVTFAISGSSIAIFIGNPYLVPAFFLGFISLPFVFVRSYSYSYKKHLQQELELSLSQITTTYLRTDDIVAAVEENIEDLGSPVRQVFESFLSQIKYINPNIRQGIEDMKDKIDNKVFKEWCECLEQCNQNHTLKYMLTPVVTKFSTLREISGAIKDELDGYKIQFFVILGIVYGNYPLLYFMNKDWFDVLIHTNQGLITTGIITFVAVVCSIILSFILKPVDYEV